MNKSREYARAAVREHKAKQVPPMLRKVWEIWDSAAAHRARREIREYIATGNAEVLHGR